jgi:hypothetical protein
MWRDTSRPPESGSEDCPLSGEQMRHAALSENPPFHSPVLGAHPAWLTRVAGIAVGRPGCRGPPGWACRDRNGQATERGSKSHTSLRSIHNDVEENQPGFAARK